jgi:iron complex outermembrane receptor protein
MPQNSVSIGADQHLHQILGIDDIDMSITYSYNFRQSNIQEAQDILAPPPAFGLLDFTIGLKEVWSGYVYTLSLRGNNILGTRYRQYMDRLRYFADSPGRNITLDIGIEF